MPRKWRTPKSENPEFYFHKLSRPRVIPGPKEKFEFEKKTRVYSYRLRVNFGGKQKVDLQNFVPEGHIRGG